MDIQRLLVNMQAWILNTFFTVASHALSSRGAQDGGRPVRLGKGGRLDATFLDTTLIDHGTLAGLADDDHAQYHTDVRGDIRYNTKAQDTTALALKASLTGDTFSGNVSAPRFTGTFSTTIANTSTANISTLMGFAGAVVTLLVSMGTDGDQALIMARGGGALTVLIVGSNRATMFSNTVGTASKLNMYYSGGELIFQNLRGGSRIITITWLG